MYTMYKRHQWRTSSSASDVSSSSGISTDSDMSSRKMTPKELAVQYRKDAAKAIEKYQRLKDIDIFVLDNSIRESTVGQLKGHTIESKWAIYNEVKKLGFKHTIVASFSHMTRVDDVFLQQLVERGEDREGLWAFSEISAGIKNKIPDLSDKVPVGIRKLEKFGFYNVIFEVDLGDMTYDFNKFSMDQMCALLKKWNQWCFDNLSKKAKIMYSIRDPPDVMPKHPERVFQLVEFFANLPAKVRPFGMMYEEPRGKSLPEEVGQWARYIRKVMVDNNWADGQLLVHVHEKFGYCDATALHALIDGATGVWASVCAEGAAMGNASSCVTLMNLVRLGNKKVLKKFNCSYLRHAAINVTKQSTGQLPHNKQPVFGQRATDFVFDLKPEEFDFASFFGEKAPVRITTLSSPEMIRTALVNKFGEDPQFTLDLTYKMKEKMLEDLRGGRREEYMSPAGIALLFDRCGGSLTEAMSEAINKVELKGPNAKRLIAEVREEWKVWDMKEAEEGGSSDDEMLEFDSFYNGFMAPYFSCYRCDDTKRAFMAIDMDSDGMVDWAEFMVYLKWALSEYPEIETKEELLNTAFCKGLIPAMRDEFIKKEGAAKK